MKARIFPKLDIPNDLQELGSFLGYYDTVQEQIDFLKYVKLEMELYYELRFEDDFDLLDAKLYNDWTKIIDKKIKFYEDILSNGDEERGITNKGNYELFNFELKKIKEFISKCEPEEAILYLKYILKEFDREKRENFYLFMEESEIDYFKENVIVTDSVKVNEDQDFTMMGIGSKQKLAIENFEKNINNEIKFLQNKSSSSFNEPDDINFDDPEEYNKMLDLYLEYGKECYLTTWKDDFQLLAFENKMIKKYGPKVRGYIYHLYKYIANKTNPIEFIGFNYEQQTKNLDEEKIKNEINRIDGYINQIEKLASLTEGDIDSKNIPEDELEKFDEWQCYYISKLKDKSLAEWINCLRKNRPGVWDYKYGEYYQVDFARVTEFALEEFKIYRDRLIGLQINFEVKSKTKRQKLYISNELIAEEVIKLWDNGLEVFEEIYQELSLQSEKLFGVQLNNNQIKGRYQRFIKTHSDYKRNKY